MSTFTQDLMSKLFGKIPNEHLTVVGKVIELHCADYNIEKISKDVVPYVDWKPECLKAFFVDRIIAGYSQGTLKMNKLYLEDMFDHIRKPLESITSNDIKLYLYNTQEARQISNRSLDSRRATIAVFFKWAAAEGYIAKDVCATVKRIKYTVKARQALSGVEREKIRLACKDLREQTMFEVLYSTGCRVGELCNLRWEDINFAEKKVSLFGKGSKWRTTPISDKALTMLTYYKDSLKGKDSEYVFSPRGKTCQMSKRNVELIIAQIGERSGIGRKLFPHLIRHSTATDLAKRGMPIQEVQACLGHERIETTMLYSHVDSEQTRIDHEKFIA